MATLTVQSYNRSGITPTYGAAASGGDEFVNTGVEFIHIKNGDASPKVLTIVTQNVSDGLAVADRTITVPATSEKMLGPFPISVYNDSAAKVQLTYDAVSSVTIAVIKAD